MARLLMQALRLAGHEVTLASSLRTFRSDPAGEDISVIFSKASAERARLAALWKNEKPDIWFTYHPYYKAPDLIGPSLCKDFAVPYVTAEASWSARRNQGVWAQTQHSVLEAVRQAAVNLCFTARDAKGLAQAAPDVRLAMLSPFIDASPFLSHKPAPQPFRLVTVAMMRHGDKMDSYRFLAKALKLMTRTPWTLCIVGDGACREEVEGLFSGFEAGRIECLGQQEPDEIAKILSKCALYVWPGCGEAYGLAYLEAQVAGLPVVAQEIAGVPEVVAHGRTGLLTPAGDHRAYADAVTRLLEDDAKRQNMAIAARQFAGSERNMAAAAWQLDAILSALAAPQSDVS